MLKELGQVFTPNWLVDYMLDLIDYNNPTILHKRILEPSCGDGAFLVEIVRRYITTALKSGFNEEETRELLEEFVMGIELDKTYYDKCIERLNNEASLYGLFNVNWNIINGDSLKLQPFDELDIIIGNPPYIRVHNLPIEDREFIKDNFVSCSQGNIDIYIAFYELAYQKIKEDGVVCYVTPNSFMRTRNAVLFREYIKSNNAIHTFVDFKDKRIFSAATYNAIMVLTKQKQTSKFNYINWSGDFPSNSEVIDLNDFPLEWNLSSNDNNTFLVNHTVSENALVNYYDIQYGFTTLRDKIYTCEKIVSIDNDIVLFNGEKVERELIAKAVKGTTYKGGDITSGILFPYIKIEGKWILLEEDVFAKKYPLGYQYLFSNKEELLKRDMNFNKEEWYAFGRMQGFKNCDKPKVLFPMIMNKEAQTLGYKLPAEVFVYGGIYITAKENYSVEDFYNIIHTEDFKKYIVLSTKDMSGGYKNVSTKQIKQFSI